MPSLPSAINLVCTRCTNGDHASLQRWYNDHAQLLMASKELQSAELLRCLLPGSSIDYFCLYRFANLADFNTFEGSTVMAQVRNLSNAALGRSSVEIVKRTQYERVLHRRWLPKQGGQASQIQVCVMALPQGHDAQTTRWLNDALYALHLKCPLHSAQIYAARLQAGSEIIVLLQSADAKPLPLDWHTLESPYAPRPSIELIWQAPCEIIAQWLR